MDSIRIRGGRPLHGTIAISGAKNAALKLMAASLLTTEPLRLSNMPDLADIDTLRKLLEHLGVTTQNEYSGNGSLGRRMTFTAGDIIDATAPYELVRKMRASVLVLGPLLARLRQARVSLPGGCAIGTRPIDLHLKGLAAMGADIDLEDGYVVARAPQGLKGAVIRFPFVSVGATENLLMAATLAKGETVLDNAAAEPEIGDLAACLVAMGAKIEGIGTKRLVITGVDALSGADHAIIPDRIEAGTYAVAAAITGGDVTLSHVRPESMGSILSALAEAGVTVTEGHETVRIAAPQGRLKPVDVTTEPYPGYPTDMQAQMMALMALADGTSVVTETIFENRFMHVPELMRMGANIRIEGSTAIVKGVVALKGAPVMATDLRASVSLVLAALAASGESVVNRVYHLDRGYERIETKLSACGADIARVTTAAAE
jgi:UDP-N-acetylglucosamine 1-carboxyvinyltransferase